MTDHKENLMSDKSGKGLVKGISGLNLNHKVRVAKLAWNSLINPQPSISSKPDGD